MKPSKSVFSVDNASSLDHNGVTSREVAWRVLLAVAAGAYANLALERELGRNFLLPGDSGLATELAYGSIRRRLTLDYWLNQLGKIPTSKQSPPLRWLLHIGLYQLLFIERVPSAAAINSTVEIAKRCGLKSLAPVVNGILRNAHRIQQSGLPLIVPDKLSSKLSVTHSLPEWLVRKLLVWRSQSGLEAFTLACNDSPQIDLRINPLRASREQVLKDFIAKGINAQPLPELPQGIQVSGRLGNLQTLPGFQTGHWCVQDRAAQWISPLLDVQPGHRVLDACAAPGGKSTHLAEIMGNTGELWAIDRSKGRLHRVRDNAQRLGLTIINTLLADGTTLLYKKPEWHQTFDRILIDAPCSGLGTLARHPDARWRINDSNIETLVQTQCQLLARLILLLKPGGRLVYATCTVNPEENEDQVSNFLNSTTAWSCLFQQTRWPSPIYGNGFFAAIFES
uniref:16S rRNA (cytosine(967)-C(5))-methyltransferase n=1 Tax=Paulinella longichromatophora TaxID=1708747 RepID=A0A2H4ZNV3_9EUKA|nr:Sun protein (Fmu protein) [Paulinella longichromatophora]